MTDTDLTLAGIPALHTAAATDGQKTLSRRSIALIGVVVVHVLMLLFFVLSPPDRVRYPSLPLETIISLSPFDRNSVALPSTEDEIPRATAPPINIPPTILPPKIVVQQPKDEEILGGIARSLACTAGQFEYLPETARAKCEAQLVPWSLDRRALEAARLRPADPNDVYVPVTGADASRRIGETADPCVGATGMSLDACRTLHPAGAAPF